MMKFISTFILITICSCVCVYCSNRSEYYTLNIVHYNDFHARFEEVNPWMGTCNAKIAPCIGGFARLASVVKDIYKRNPDSLLLNAGDSFQGTLWYNLLRWNVTQEFMNLLPHDAHAIGNHEFDNGPEGLIPYLKNLRAVSLIANMNDSKVPELHGLYKKSEIFIRNGRRVGVIGVTIAKTKTLSSAGLVEFTDEIEAVRRESLILNENGIDIIIVLSHCGIELDRIIAEKGGPYIDIIVGGHSHTLLYNGQQPGKTKPEGPYPVVVHQNNNREVLIVQAAAFTEYLGEIMLFFDNEGNIMRWSGTPHYLSNDIPQDPEVLERLEIYKADIEQKALKPVGESRVLLSNDCSCEECNLGDLICDAFLYSVLPKARPGNWHYANLCIINQGGIRIPISPGNITFGELLMSSPFENMVEVFELRGDHLLETLEYSISHTRHVGAHMLQVSGMRVKFDNSAPLGNRVQSVSVRCIDCPVPVYEPLRNDTYYKVVTHSFLGKGGDGFTAISRNRRKVESVVMDYVAITNFLQRENPVIQGIEGRIQFEELLREQYAQYKTKDFLILNLCAREIPRQEEPTRQQWDHLPYLVCRFFEPS